VAAEFWEYLAETADKNSADPEKTAVPLNLWEVENQPLPPHTVGGPRTIGIHSVSKELNGRGTKNAFLRIDDQTMLKKPAEQL
jgi:hypothetical protein